MMRIVLVNKRTQRVILFREGTDETADVFQATNVRDEGSWRLAFEQLPGKLAWDWARGEENVS